MRPRSRFELDSTFGLVKLELAFLFVHMPPSAPCLLYVTGQAVRPAPSDWFPPLSRVHWRGLLPWTVRKVQGPT